MRSSQTKGGSAAASQCRRVHHILDELQQLVVPMCADADEGDEYVDKKNGIVDRLRDSIDLLVTIAASSSSNSPPPSRDVQDSQNNALPTPVASAAVEKAVAPYRAKVVSLAAEVERLKKLLDEKNAGRHGSSEQQAVMMSSTSGARSPDPFARFETFKSMNPSKTPHSGASPSPAGSTTGVNYKELLASHIIDRTFDQHKSMLRSQLHDAVTQLEHFRSGAFYKSQMAATEELKAKIAAQDDVIGSLKQKVVELLTDRVTQRRAPVVVEHVSRGASSALESSWTSLLLMQNLSHAWRVFELQMEAQAQKHHFVMDQLFARLHVVRLTPSPPMRVPSASASDSIKDCSSGHASLRKGSSGPPIQRNRMTQSAEDVVSWPSGPIAVDDVLVAISSGRQEALTQRTHQPHPMADALLSCNLPPLHLNDPTLPRRGFQQASHQQRQRQPL